MLVTTRNFGQIAGESKTVEGLVAAAANPLTADTVSFAISSEKDTQDLLASIGSGKYTKALMEKPNYPVSLRFLLETPDPKTTTPLIGAAVATAALKTQPDKKVPEPNGSGMKYVDPVYLTASTGAGVVFGAGTSYGLSVLIMSFTEAAKSSGNLWMSTIAGASALIGAGIGGAAGFGLLSKIKGGLGDYNIEAEIRSPIGTAFG